MPEFEGHSKRFFANQAKKKALDMTDLHNALPSTYSTSGRSSETPLDEEAEDFSDSGVSNRTKRDTSSRDSTPHHLENKPNDPGFEDIKDFTEDDTEQAILLGDVIRMFEENL